MSKFRGDETLILRGFYGDPGKIRASDLRFRKPFTGLLHAVAQRGIAGNKSHYINRCRDHCIALNCIDTPQKAEQSITKSITKKSTPTCGFLIRGPDEGQTSTCNEHVYSLAIGLGLAGIDAAVNKFVLAVLARGTANACA